MTAEELASIIDDAGYSLPNETAISDIETLIGSTLPEDYRAFLSLTPGGQVYGRVLFSLSGEPVGTERLSRVAGVRPEPDLSLVERFHSANDNDVPLGLLSIMTDGGGNDIAISLRPDRFGEIFFLDHEVSGGEGSPALEEAESDDWGYAIKFASSFSELINGFTVDR